MNYIEANAYNGYGYNIDTITFHEYMLLNYYIVKDNILYKIAPIGIRWRKESSRDICTKLSIWFIDNNEEENTDIQYMGKPMMHIPFHEDYKLLISSNLEEFLYLVAKPEVNFKHKHKFIKRYPEYFI